MAIDRERVYFVLFALYVAILVVATVGELFDIDAILDVFDVKKVFSW